MEPVCYEQIETENCEAQHWDSESFGSFQLPLLFLYHFPDKKGLLKCCLIAMLVLLTFQWARARSLGS